MNDVYLLLGSNIGEREKVLDDAMHQVGQEMGAVIKKSSLYETEPWGFKDDINFLNQVVVIQTTKTPEELLDKIKLIEGRLGRIRTTGKGYTSRIIDIDILFYGELIHKTDDLTIPHPLMQERRFVMMPLAEIASEKIHPELNKTMNKLLDECDDLSMVKKLG